MNCFICLRKRKNQEGQKPIFRASELCSNHYQQFKIHLNLKMNPQQRQNWCYNNGIVKSKQIEIDPNLNHVLQQIRTKSLNK